MRAIELVRSKEGREPAKEETEQVLRYCHEHGLILISSGTYGNVLRDQQMAYAGRFLGSELVNPDFVRFAESFGVEAHRVASPEALRPVLERAFAAAAPILIEVSIPRGADGNPWPFIHSKFPDQTAF